MSGQVLNTYHEPQLTVLAADHHDAIVLDLDRTGSLRYRRLLINTTTGLYKQAALRSSYKHRWILAPERQPFPLPKGISDKRHARDIRTSRRILIPLKMIGCVGLTYSRNIQLDLGSKSGMRPWRTTRRQDISSENSADTGRAWAIHQPHLATLWSRPR